METTPEPAAPSTEELADLEVAFARLEAELTALDDVADHPAEPSGAAEEAGG
jgi:hypothetical protein